jgi:hypothetical protein
MTEMYLSPNPPAPLKLRGTGSSLLRKEWGYVFVVQLYIPLLAKQGGGLRGWVYVTKHSRRPSVKNQPGGLV